MQLKGGKLNSRKEKQNDRWGNQGLRGHKVWVILEFAIHERVSIVLFILHVKWEED